MKPRIAASHYLNSAPLIWSFLHGIHRGKVDLIDAVPARCADLLRTGQVDAALVPVIEYQRMQNVELVADVCVGSRQRVRSVVLASKVKDLREVRSVALDESSRTSAVLTKIIFREFLGNEPTWNQATPDLNSMLKLSDAALIIGDPAMTFTREGLHVFDLASLWHGYTGLGFVFAMWMKPVSSIMNQLDFSVVRDEGLSDINTIVDEYQAVIPLPREELIEYLTQNISYTIDETMRAGMEKYFELAHRHELIPEERVLRFAT